MYNKNLSEDLRLRLSTDDMNFLRELSDQRQVTVSECIRSIVSEYRRSLETIDILQRALTLTKGEGAVHGYTETDINNKL